MNRIRWLAYMFVIRTHKRYVHVFFKMVNTGFPLPSLVGSFVISVLKQSKSCLSFCRTKD